MLSLYALMWFVVKVLAVSFPEALTEVYIGFLVMGLTKFLPYICDKKDFKTNVYRILSFSAIYAVSFELMRLIFPVPVLAFPFKTAVVLLSLKYIYKIKWKEAWFSVIAMLLFLALAEPLVTSLVLNIFNISLVSLEKGGTYSLIIGSLAARIVSLIVIASLWNLRIIRDDLTKRRKLNKKRTLQLISFLVSLVLLEALLGYFALDLFYTYRVIKKVFAISGFLLIGYTNYMVFLVYLNIVRNTVEHLVDLGKEDDDKDEKNDNP